jgi:Terpene synthase family 2, C-terminal metal binding
MLCLNEYCNQPNLPTHIMQDEDMAALRNLTNANICSVNDLLSVKVEVAQCSIQSLIPILYTILGFVQAAADQVMETVRSTIREFDVTASWLQQRFDNEVPEVVTALRRFVAGCQYCCTGNLNWR